ncbi:GDSL-type esterase/lipase family protein [Fictibacillus sp. Mic-4]|uniref:GDSL-type esterase/lipase family protein n=1 Tax=Fictibacillus sp. Mic-4 TaxID=3132826 RepID=UPI003CF6FE51
MLKKRYWFLISFLCLIIAGFAWFFYPQMKIYWIKSHSAAPVTTKNKTNVTYIDHLKNLKKPTIRHLILGDSVAKGKGSTDGGFAAIASRQLADLTGKKVLVDNQGVSGFTSADLLQFIQGRLLKEKIQNADLITINIGGNDLVKTALKDGPVEAIQHYQTVKENYAEHLDQIFNFIRKENPKAIIVTNELYNAIDSDESFYPATKRLLSDWNLIAYETAADYMPTVVIPSSEVLTTEDRKKWIYDSIHPNELGHRRIANAMIKILEIPFSKQ